jgi:hypothetical protein
MNSRGREAPPAVPTIAPFGMTREEAIRHLKVCHESDRIPLLKLGAYIEVCHGAVTCMTGLLKITTP